MIHSASFAHRLDSAAALASLRDEMRRLLSRSIQLRSVSGEERAFVQFIEDWARRQGLATELWETDEASLARHAQAQAPHLPLAGRPTLLARLPGRGGGRSLIFNAHSDVVAEGDGAAWRHDPWGGEAEGDLIYGRGAADDKGPLISALWALAALRRIAPEGLAGDVMLELVPGEEDCVGLGTLTSVAHGVRADGAIILEPTEEAPRCASRGGCRFRIDCRGRAVHGTVKWLGEDAIALMRRVLDRLERMEVRWNHPDADRLFAAYPLARPVTVDAVQGGRWQGMVCDACRCEGYLEMLPGDDHEEWKARFASEVKEGLDGQGKEGAGAIEVSFSEDYAGHATPPEHPLCRLAADVMREAAGVETPLMGFNSGCEAGLRAGLHGTPTLVWGPGSLAQAHAPDEFISFESVQRVAAALTAFSLRWTAPGEKSSHVTDNLS